MTTTSATACLQYRRPIGPVQSFFHVSPTPQLRALMVRKYRALGWEYLMTYKDTRGYGISASRFQGY